MENERLDRVIESMIRIPPIIHRKLHREFFKVMLQQFGIDIAPHHLMIMKELQESGTLHSSEIGDAISIAKPQMTHAIDKLISMGIVEREPDTKDRRKINIRLTHKGQETLERLDNNMKNILTEKLSILSGDELERLAGSFNYIAETFSKLQ
jgi:DNA-binding MarR family transcriptional regulator